MRHNRLILAFCFALFLQLSLYAKDNTILEQTTIKTISGESINVSKTKQGLVFKGYEDKIILLEMFGYGCPPCKEAIPAYKRLQEKYKKDIVVIAVEVWGSDDAKLKQYAKSYGLDYKAVSKANSGKIVSFVGSLTGWNTGTGVPYLMLLSRGGDIAKDVPPQIFPEAYVDGLIKEML